MPGPNSEPDPDRPGEPDAPRSTATPLLIALAIVVIVLAVVTGLRSCRGEEISAEAGVGRAVIGQNDALQRGNYADFRRFTCAAEQGTEDGVLAAQRKSAESNGPRYVDDVRGFAVNGDRATATVVYHFEKSPDDKLNTLMTFAREGGDWKVCSAGPS
ncbi:MAG: hypothetical protein QG671_1598 [Actinomycetota bacterium]|nr:hypothetical protein [Actinomycetota bacterium]